MLQDLYAAAQQQQAALHLFAQQPALSWAYLQQAHTAAGAVGSSQDEQQWHQQSQPSPSPGPVTLFRPKARRAEAADHEQLLEAASCGLSQGSGRSSQSHLGSNTALTLLQRPASSQAQSMPPPAPSLQQQ